MADWDDHLGQPEQIQKNIEVFLMTVVDSYDVVYVVGHSSLTLLGHCIHW